MPESHEQVLRMAHNAMLSVAHQYAKKGERERQQEWQEAAHVLYVDLLMPEEQAEYERHT